MHYLLRPSKVHEQKINIVKNVLLNSLVGPGSRGCVNNKSEH